MSQQNKEPTVEWLIDQIAPNEGNSPLLEFNKKRLKAAIEVLIDRARDDTRLDELQLLGKHVSKIVPGETWEQWCWRVQEYLKHRVANLKSRRSE